MRTALMLVAPCRYGSKTIFLLFILIQSYTLESQQPQSEVRGRLFARDMCVGFSEILLQVYIPPAAGQTHNYSHDFQFICLSSYNTLRTLGDLKHSKYDCCATFGFTCGGSGMVLPGLNRPSQKE